MSRVCFCFLRKNHLCQAPKLCDCQHTSRAGIPLLKHRLILASFQRVFCFPNRGTIWSHIVNFRYLSLFTPCPKRRGIAPSKIFSRQAFRMIQIPALLIRRYCKSANWTSSFWMSRVWECSTQCIPKCVCVKIYNMIFRAHGTARRHYY